MQNFQLKSFEKQNLFLSKINFNILKQRKELYYFQTENKTLNLILNKFLNLTIKKGKKQKAYSIIIDSFFILKKDFHHWNPYKVFFIAILNTIPSVKLNYIKKGNKSIPVPIALTSEQKIILAIKWILEESRKNKEKKFSWNLANQLNIAYKGQGPAIIKKKAIHKLAVANQIYL